MEKGIELLQYQTLKKNYEYLIRHLYYLAIILDIFSTQICFTIDHRSLLALYIVCMYWTEKNTLSFNFYIIIYIWSLLEHLYLADQKESNHSERLFTNVSWGGDQMSVLHYVSSLMAGLGASVCNANEEELPQVWSRISRARRAWGK